MGETRAVRCRACGAPAEDRAVDHVRGVLRCSSCGTISELPAAPGAAPRKDPPAPAEMVVSKEGDALRIRWPYAIGQLQRPQPAVGFVLVGGVVVILVALHEPLLEQFPFSLFAFFVATLFVALGYWMIAAGSGAFHVVADPRELSMRMKPLPLRRGSRVATADLRLLYTVERVMRISIVSIVTWEVRWRDERGWTGTLAEFRSSDTALFLERSLERHLRIADRSTGFEAAGRAAPPTGKDIGAVACDACGAVLDLAQADRAAGTVRCGSCGSLASLAGKLRASLPASALAGLPIPRRFDATYDRGRLELRWRRFHGVAAFLGLFFSRGKMFLGVLLLFCIGAGTGQVRLVAGAIAAAWLYALVASMIHRTTLTLDAGGVRTRNGPLPLPWLRNRAIPADRVLRFQRVVKPGTGSRGFLNSERVVAELRDGKSTVLGSALEVQEAEFIAAAANAALRELQATPSSERAASGR